MRSSDVTRVMLRVRCGDWIGMSLRGDRSWSSETTTVIITGRGFVFIYQIN